MAQHISICLGNLMSTRLVLELQIQYLSIESELNEYFIK